MSAWQVLPSQLGQGPDFLAGEWVRAIDTVHGPPHMDAAAIKLDHIPSQRSALFSRYRHALIALRKLC